MTPVLIQATSEISLRTWTLANAAELFALVQANRAELSTWLPWVPAIQTEQNSANFIQKAIEETANDVGLELGIFFQNTLVGCIGLHELNREHQKTSIGYWLGSAFQGKGFMTAAVQALIEFSFTSLKFNRIEIRAATGNEKSRAIPVRLGFTQEGILREAERVGDTYFDDVVYSLLLREWKEARSSLK